MKRLHLCIVTGQPLANLIPLLQERPDKVFLLHSDSDDKHDDAQAFVRILIEAGFDKGDIVTRSGLPTHPFNDILMYAMEIHEAITTQFPDIQMTWNATGGTKHMALAIWDVLDRKRDRVIYTETKEGFIEELTPVGQEKPLDSLLTPELYLSALGKIKRRSESDNADWRERVDARKAATWHLGANVEALTGLIQQFNRQIESDGKNLQTITLDRIGAQWQQALQLLEQNGVLDHLGEGHYSIPRAEVVRYLTGGWLEEYVWLVAKSQGVEHVEVGLKFGDLAHRKQGQDNEVDLFIVHHNRLLLVECKSGGMGRDGRKDGDIIYKLDSIGLRAGGTQATRLLVSAQPLQHETRAGRMVDTRARASATGIHTLEAGGLKSLGDGMRQWKESGQWQR